MDLWLVLVTLSFVGFVCLCSLRNSKTSDASRIDRRSTLGSYTSTLDVLTSGGYAVYRSATRPTTCSEVQCTGLPLCNPAYPDETFKRALDPWALARATSASLVGEGGAFLQGNGCVPSLPRVGRVAARWTAYPEGGRVGSRTHV